MTIMRVLGLTCVLLALAVTALAQSQGPEYVENPPVKITDPGNAVKHLLYARPFSLDVPYSYTWTHEKAEITSGYLLVVEVEPEFARPRDTWMPVLYVGWRPAEVTNVDLEKGRMVVIVPGDVDLTQEPIFFGSVELPEKVTSERGREEMAAALALGIHPIPSKELAAALEIGGERLSVRDAKRLYFTVADLIDQYAPSDHSRAESYRVKAE
jgi:hypothetical protein